MPRRPVTSLVLFDFYNTLVSIETDERDAELWEKSARFIGYHGVNVSADYLRKEYLRAIDSGIESSSEEYHQTNELKIFQTLLEKSGCSSEEAGLVRLATEVLLFFRTESIRRFELFPDTIPALESLHNLVDLGIVTDAQRVFVEPEMRGLGIAKYFGAVVISGDYDVHKPDARLFREALARFHRRPEATTFVGDNAWRDIGGAKGLNLHAVLLDRERTFAAKEGDPPPDDVIYDLRDLRPLLLRSRRLGH